MRLHYLHSTNVQIPAANAVQTMHMCEAFASRGCEVVLRYPHYAAANAVPESECHAYYGVRRSFALEPLDARFTPALMRSRWLPLVKLWAYAKDAARARDIIYTRCATAAAAMPTLRRLGPRPLPLVVFEAHEFPRDRARARALRRVDAIVAITRATAGELTAAAGIPACRICVEPDGMPSAWLAAMSKAEARHLIGVNAEQPIVVYTGRLYADTAAQLLDMTAALAGRASVIAVGAPPDDQNDPIQVLDDLRRDAARLPAGAITFTGGVRVDQVRAYQAAADVLIAPYSGTLRWARYTSPLKIFEYMASGRPMVVSDLPALHEVLTHDRDAWFVRANDGAAMAAGVRGLIDDPATGERIAAAAAAAAPSFTWDARAGRILDFLAKAERPR